ncbi:DUF2793 domain-containing protein [bacterium]|nr:DUF2793 domain-containing protein [Candidatus Elulimicrobium humile]
MAKNKGTLITAPIRPNDSLDLIASALANEIAGGLHSVATITDRNFIYQVRREWGMIVSVYNDGANTGYYTLKRGWVSEDIADNGNWVKLDLGDGSNYWFDPVEKWVLSPSDIVSPSTGDRFLIGTPSTGIFATQSGKIATWNGTTYIYQEPYKGSVVLDLNTESLYFYNNSWPLGSWNQLGGSTASGGGSNIIFQDTSTINFVTYSLGSQVYVSANIFTNSITPSLLNTGTYSGATMGKVLSVDEVGNFNWIDGGSSGTSGTSGIDGTSGTSGIDGTSGTSGVDGTSGTSGIDGTSGTSGITPEAFTLSIIDYNTGVTFSGVKNIIFRGGVVNTPEGTASGVSVLGTPPTVTVWIPAPTYVGYFSPTLFSDTTDRFVSNPLMNFFEVGDWSPNSDFSSDILRDTINSAGLLVAFTQSNFACFTTGTTMSFTIYGATGSILSTIDGFVIGGVGSTSSLGITLSVTGFSTDEDRYKASVSGVFQISSILPNGGRFRIGVTHYNGEGPGNTSSGVYEFFSQDIFYDSDGPSSSITVGGPIVFDEISSSLVQYSGVSYYKIGQTFSLTASSINLLNDQSFPNSVQVRFTLTNMAVSGNYDGYADGTKIPNGVAITGWTIDYNNTGLTYSRNVTVNQTGQYIPGFSTNNTVSTTPVSYINFSTFDWSLVAITQSSRKLMLYDTLSAVSPTYNNDPIESETGRLIVSTITQSGTASFDSTISLSSTYLDELQYIWGRVIFPQTDFTQFYPSVNLSAVVDYSGLTGSVKTFNVFTDLENNISATVSFSGYRWHATSYTKGGSSFGNGIFTMNSNFQESYLDYNGVSFSAGTGDLVILLGIDNTGSNLTPDSFIFVSADSTVFPGRVDSLTYNLSLTPENNKKIAFTKGSGTATVNKIWLLVGYKNTLTGKNLRFTNIALS